MNNSLPYNVADHTKVYGNKHFRHYLVGKNHDLLIECGVTASANQFIKQLVDSRIGAPDKLLVMHAHFDHVCGIPVLKHNFPDAKVLSSAAAAKVLKNPKVVEKIF